ncbi:hypothetical protein D9M71_806360 [compost metagenome]
MYILASGVACLTFNWLSTAATPTVLPNASEIFSASSVLRASPATVTLSPSTEICRPSAFRPCLSSSFFNSSAVAAFASLAPKSFSPTSLMKLSRPIVFPLSMLR